MSLFSEAEKIYRALGVDVDSAFRRVADIPVSIHCWQGDDVKGFEDSGSLDGGIAVTGNYPGCARTPEELRNDIDKVMSLVPGTKRLNVHAIYAESDGGKIERNNITAANFKNWMEWSKVNNIALDFNPTFFAHPMAADGFTLSNADPAIRKYWVEHGIACRKIAAEFGKAQSSACITNFWTPDGFKDTPVDREAPRARLKESLDEIFAVEVDEKYNRDAMECKLFGIGAESCTVGSHEFYMGYAMKNNKLICLDAGHFHPTEVISDKISSVLLFSDEVLLHVSRGVRWDSDHVVILNDELYAIAQEILRHNYEKRVHIGLDYFDASINRIGAWAIGARAMQKALLAAALEPTQLLKEVEAAGDNTSRLALLEDCKNLPFGAMWQAYCEYCKVPGADWLKQVKEYEKNVLSKR
ncbi:MAG: L-rhamnose isomerase [Lentisphaerae bacterium]|nr:L-rhamnose isomerase [Lentisphaerota bacterium]